MTTPTPVTSDVKSCARCGGDHLQLEFRHLIRPIAPVEMHTSWTLWAPCPINGEPILLATYGGEGHPANGKPPAELTPLSRAIKAFNAYNEQGPNPWKTFDGRDVPRWEQLNDQVRAKWLAAAEVL